MLVIENAAPPPERHTQESRIHDAGEMARLTRAFDWSTTPVGPIEGWASALVITVNLLLECRNPMFLWWGEELTQFYNDAYRLTLRGDKHPEALGRRGRASWPEIWHIIGPQIEAVQSGETIFQRDALVPIYRDGVLTDVYWTYSYSPVRDAEGRVAGVLVVCSDTTDEVISSSRLRSTEERFRHLFENSSIGFVLADLEGTITYLNPFMLSLLGYTAAEVAAGKVRWTELTPPEYAEADARAVEQLLATGRAEPYEKAYVARNGRRISLLLSATMLQKADGTQEVAGLVTEISDLRRAENALRHSEKLAAVGRLASSVAHEINNPLEALTNCLYLLSTDLHSPDAPAYLALAQQELNRVAAITTQTLRFHRQSHPREVRFPDLLNGVLTIFQGRFFSAKIEVCQRMREAPPFLCYDGDVRQVLANLLSNALDASRNGGKIYVRSQLGTHWRTGRPGLHITVADTGQGMSPEVRARIFEAFFTTKDATGIGLGLWITCEILNRHGASIRVRSRQGEPLHGTVVSVWFPLDAARSSSIFSL